MAHPLPHCLEPPTPAAKAQCLVLQAPRARLDLRPRYSETKIKPEVRPFLALHHRPKIRLDRRPRCSETRINLERRPFSALDRRLQNQTNLRLLGRPILVDFLASLVVVFLETTRRLLAHLEVVFSAMRLPLLLVLRPKGLRPDRLHRSLASQRKSQAASLVI